MSTVGRYTSLQALVAVFHCSVIKWIYAARQTRSIAVRLSTQELFWLWMQLMEDCNIAPKNRPVDSELGEDALILDETIRYCNCSQSSTSFGNSFFRYAEIAFTFSSTKDRCPFHPMLTLSRQHEWHSCNISRSTSSRWGLTLALRPPAHIRLFWLQQLNSNKSSFHRWRTRAWFFISAKVVHCIFIFLVNTQNSTGWKRWVGLLVVELTPFDKILRKITKIGRYNNNNNNNNTTTYKAP